MPRLSIRGRITLMILVVAGGLLVLMSVVVYLTFQQQLNASLDETLEVQAATNQRLLASSGYRLETNTASQPGSDGADGDGVLRLYDSDGALLDNASPGFPANEAELKIVNESLATQKPAYQTVKFGSEDNFRLIASPVFENGRLSGSLVTGVERSDVEESLRILLAILLVGVPVTTIAIGLGGYWIARRALVPVAEMTLQADQIASDNIDARLGGADAKDELGLLSRTLNSMLSRLQQAIQQERQFASDASHELRTPLAVIESGIDVTLDRERTPKQYQETLIRIREQTGRLRTMTNQLLLLARMDADTLQTQFVLIDLAELIPIIVEPLREQYPQSTIFTDIEPGNLWISGELELVARALINLLDNALRYGGDTVSVVITVRRRDDGLASVVVADDGPGIATSHASRIFDRFGRGANSGNEQGTGLGLAIVRSIMRVHHGTISLLPPADRHGAVFELRFPTVQTP